MPEETLVFQDALNNKVAASLSYVSPESLVVLLHGFSSHKNNATNRSLVPILNRSGVSTLAVDFYGSGASGGELEDITVSKAIANVEAAIGQARARGFKRIGLFGSSFGGGVAVAVAARHPADVSILALKAPVSDLKSVLEQSYGGEAGIRKWKDFGVMDYISSTTGEKHPLAYSFYEDAAKQDFYKYAGALETPTLIIHGTSDNTVPIDQSRKLLEEIGSEKKRLEEIHGADHRFTNQEHFNRMLDLSAGWLLKIKPNTF